jgi:hypothetical protein
MPRDGDHRALKLARINTTHVRLTPAPRRRGRPTGVGHCRQRARQAIAEGIVAGKTVAAIARELGVTRSWASREAHAPGTRELVDALADQYREVIDALLESLLNTIAPALRARKFVMHDGNRIDMGPDHRLRMKAVDLLLQLGKAMDVCLADDHPKATVETYRFFRKLHSLAAKVMALVP